MFLQNEYTHLFFLCHQKNVLVKKKNNICIWITKFLLTRSVRNSGAQQIPNEKYTKNNENKNK